MDDNKQKKPLDERIENTLNEALYRAQNAIYGEKNGSDDVPYTMEMRVAFAARSPLPPGATSPCGS